MNHTTSAQRSDPAKTRDLRTRFCVDWFRVLADLKKAEYGLVELAATLGFNRSRLYGWKNYGVQPPHWAGEALLALHTEYLGTPIPMLSDRPVRKNTKRDRREVIGPTIEETV